jgi:hypothetical protein
VKSGKALV